MMGWPELLGLARSCSALVCLRQAASADGARWCFVVSGGRLL